MKFPRSRRDRLKNQLKRQKAEQQRQENCDECDAPKKHIPFAGIASHAPPLEHTSYPHGYVPEGQRNVFDQESVQPLGANMESWSNLIDSRATSHQIHLNQANSTRTYTDDELFDDEVFFNEDDMRKMRLGFTDPSSSYYMYPGAFATIAMMGAVPEESQFGQGLEYFGPGYHIGASGLEIFFCLWNVLTYLLDIGSDIYLAYLYFMNSHYIWFGLTLAFVAVPAITMSAFSLVLYLRDYKYAGDKKSHCRWASRIIFIVLQLAPFFRMFETLIYGCKSRDPEKDVLKRRHFYDKMVDEDTDAMLLRLFESFMEAAPQLVLQLYIITQIGTDKGTFLVVVQVFGLVTSLLSLASCLVSFQKSLRLSIPEKEKLRFPGMALIFLWRLFTITARVLAIAMFASYFKYWTFVAIGIHWIAMLIWVIKQDTQYCTVEDSDGQIVCNRCHEMCFRILSAFVQIFCFFNLLEGHTRLRCLLFYCIVYAENAFFVMAWYIGASTKTSASWYHLPTLIMVLVGFWFGILFQVMYYKACHPNNSSVLHSQKRILWYVPCSHLSLTQETQYHPKPAGSVLNRSHLSLNQTTHSYHSLVPDSEKLYIASTPAPSVANTNNEPMRKTPLPEFHPNRSSTLTDGSSLMSRQSSFSQALSQPRARVIQKKWQPPERPPPGMEKLNMSRDSGSSRAAPGSVHRTRQFQETRQTRTKDGTRPSADVDNQEPLPTHLHGMEPSGSQPPARPPVSRVLPVQRTPPVLKVANLSHNQHQHDVSVSGSDEDSSDLDSNTDDRPLTTTNKLTLAIPEEDELPVEDELPPVKVNEEASMMKVTAL